MKVTVIITTQHYENYNVGPEGFGETPCWKPKGSYQFKMEIDSDTLFYCDRTDEIFTKMVAAHDNIAQKFEYVGYEIQWHEPEQLGTEEYFKSVYSSLV